MYRRGSGTRAYRKPRTAMARLAGSFRGPTRPLPELKFFDTVGASSSLFNTAAIYLPISIIAGGTDSNQRLGRTVTMKSLQLRFYVVDGSSQTIPYRCRILVVYDKLPNQAATTIGSILNAGPSGSPDSLSTIQLNNRHQYVVLMDKIFTVEYAASVRGSHVAIDKYIKLPNLRSVYTSATGNIANTNEGLISMFFLCDTLNVGSQNPTCNFTTRIRFVDG